VDIEQARAEWTRVRPEHRVFAELIEKRLTRIARKLGIYAEVSAREKEVHSLVKKLIRKTHLSYETLPDKVGARIVIRYRSELSVIEECIRQEFQFKAVEDKGSKLGVDRVGYQSIHIDGLALKVDDPEASRFPAKEFFAELQLRSYGQHFWSEVSHDTFYKNDELVNELSPDLQRRVNLTAGLIEVADREFDHMKDEAQPGPAAIVFSGLEKLYYSVATKRPDVELSLAVINLVLPLYGASSAQEILQNHIVPTFERHRQNLERIYSDPDNEYGGVSAFFFQPEALLILDRLYFDRDQLLKAWNQQFPTKELERVAENFGIAINE
jgi:ppGpp synthetase/RelA/SpoT-type nucleotidyltranferase